MIKKKAAIKSPNKTRAAKIKKNSAKQSPKSKSVGTSRKNDFIDQAMVYDGLPLAVTVDSTSVVEISQMLNEHFSKEQFDDAKKIFKIDKLKKLKRPSSYLKEGKKQILGLWKCIESFTAHSDLFRTSFLIAIGQILNHIEESLNSKSTYMKWLRSNFGHKHLRYFQHAKQLAKMGAFVRNYACLGKNRLLELERTRKELGNSFYELLSKFPFEDTTVDHDGSLFKEHVDGIITYYRLQNAGVDCVEFDQAALIGGQLNGAITKKLATGISKWLQDKDDKSEALDDLILNKMAYPDTESVRTSSRPSIRKHLADLINYSESIDFENDAWISSIRDQVDEEDLKRAYNFMVILADKLGIELTQPNAQASERRAA